MAEIADLVTVALDELLPRADGPESRLTEAMRYAALGPGKRLRPFFAIETGGLRVAVWIFDSHGGEKQARKLAARILKSYTPATAPRSGG